MSKSLFVLLAVFAIFAFADEQPLFDCGYYQTQCYSGIQNSFYLEGEYNKHSKKVQYTYTLYNTALCQEDSVVMTAVYTADLINCHNETNSYFLTANCTVSHPTYIATMVNNALADKIITCDKPWKNNAKKDIFNDDFSCKYEGWNDLKSMLINNVRDQRDNGVALYEHFGTGAIYMGFGYAGFRMYKVDDYGCAGYIRPIKVDGATMSGWIVALIVVVVVGLAIWLYFRRQKKVALEDNFTLMEEKANKF